MRDWGVSEILRKLRINSKHEGVSVAKDTEQPKRTFVRRAVTPFREGKYLILQSLQFSAGPAADGSLHFVGRVVLRVRGGPAEYHGKEETPDGAVTALQRAMVQAITRIGIEPPPMRIASFSIGTTGRRRRSPDAPAIVRAKLRLDGWEGRLTVRHPDGATAAACAYFDAYDALCYEQLRQRLAVAHITPEEAIEQRTLRE